MYFFPDKKAPKNQGRNELLSAYLIFYWSSRIFFVDFSTFRAFVLIKLLYYCDFNCCALILKNAKIASCIHEKKRFKRNLKKYAVLYGLVLLLILLA